MSNQNTTSVGSHSHSLKPLKYKARGMINARVKKVTNVIKIRIQMALSVNMIKSSPFTVIE